MPKVIMRIILKPHGRYRRPLCMLFGNALARNTRELELLTPAQLANQGSFPLRIQNRRRAHPLIRAVVADDKIPRVHLHDLIRRAPRMQRQPHAAPRARALARAVPVVLHVAVAVARHQRNQAQAVRQKLIRDHRRVLLNLHDIDRDGRHFRQHHPPQGVGECEVDRAELEVDPVGFSLMRH